MTKDLKFAWRMLAKAPLLTVAIVLSLGIGIGGCVTVFCWMQSILLRPFSGVPRNEELVVLTGERGGVLYETMSHANILDFQKLTNVFRGVIASQMTPASLKYDGKMQWAYGQITTPNFFNVLEVVPEAGRFFRPEEGASEGTSPVLVISHAYWQRRFGGEPGIVGKTVEVNEQTFTIIGITPPTFHGTMSGLKFDFWAPVGMHQRVAHFGSMQSRGDHWMHCQARLAPGVGLEQARAAFAVLTHRLQQEYPDANKELHLNLMPLWKSPYGGQAFFLPMLRVLGAVSILVLFVVCANTANMLLARAASRQREIAVRLAMGASRMRIVRQLLIESMVLSALGGTAALAFSAWGRFMLLSFVPNTHLPVGYDFEMDTSTVCFTFLVVLAAAVLFGLAPALHSTGTQLGEVLKEGGRSETLGRGKHRLRGALVVAEVAMSLLLLTGAGLCMQAFNRAQAVNMGFDPKGVLVAGLRLGAHGYTEQQGIVFYRRLLDRLSSVPGVQKAALTSYVPMGFEGGAGCGLQVPGYAAAPNEEMSAGYSIVSPGYLETLRVPLLEGRDFESGDDWSRGKAAIVNKRMADRFWPGQGALGKKFGALGNKEVTVVGVVANGKYRRLDEDTRCYIFIPYTQGAWDLNLGVLVRTGGAPAALARPVRAAVSEIDPRVDVWAMLSLEEYTEPAFLAQRMATMLMGAMGLVALVLAALGIYGVMSYSVSQRTQEIGVRMALGATVGDVIRLVLRGGMRLCLWGIGIGLISAFGAARVLASVIYGVSSLDLASYAVVAAVMTGVGLAACYIPARRAASTDPVTALRGV